MEFFARTSLAYNFNRVDKLHSAQANEEGWISGVAFYRVGKPVTFRQAEFAGYTKDGNQSWYVPGEFEADGSRKVTDKYSASLETGLDYALLDAPFHGGLSLGATWRGQISLVLDFTFQLVPIHSITTASSWRATT